MSNLHSHAYWLKAAKEIETPNQAFISGGFTPAQAGKTFDCISPVDGSLLTQISSCEDADVDLAVAAARTAFDRGPWPRMSAKDRKRILLRLADLVERHAEDFALLETLDMGMPIRDAVSLNVPSSAECIAWYAEAIDKHYDEVAPTGPGAVTMIRKAPIGVVAAVVPWNYPLMIACWKIAPILATGNTMMLKPAEQATLTALKLAELSVEAGLPDGVLNVVPGAGPTTGQALGRHMQVDGLTFTGSTQIGKKFMIYSGESNMKRVSLECGGKTPHIVLKDAPDLDAVAQSVALGIYFNQGEVCNAGSRLIVEEAVHDDLLDRIKVASADYFPGDPLDPEVKVGAIVDEKHMNNVLTYVDCGLEEGAKLSYGGKRIKAESGGYYIAPTMFEQVSSDMRIAQEEIFGPVLSAIKVKDAEQAVHVANGTKFGLGAAVWTRDITTAHQMAEKVRAGVVWINCHDHGDISSPVGGFGQSGFGRDKSLHAMDKYQDYKTTWINLG